MTEASATKTDSIGGLLRHTSIYAIVPLVQRVMALLLVNAYTQRLSNGEWGVISMTDLFLTLLPIMVGMNLIAGLSRQYFVYDNQEDRASVISGAMVTMLSLAAVGCALSIIFSEQIAGMIFSGVKDIGNTPYVDYISICALIVPLSLASTLGLETLQIRKQSQSVVKITLAKTLFEAALKLFFLFILDWGVLGFLLAILIGEAVIGAAMLVYLVRTYGTRLVKRTFMPFLHYTLPLIPVGAFQLGLHQADKFLIERLGPQDAVILKDGEMATVALQWVGIYNLGYQIAFLFHTAAMTSFMRIWVPNVFAMRDDHSRAPHVNRIGTLVALGIAALYAQVALFGREGVHILAGQASYLPAQKVVPWVAAGYVAYALYALAQATLMSVFATKTLALINFVALCVNLGLNYFLIPRYGYEGAAAATTISFAFLAGVAAIESSRRGLAPFRLYAVVAGSAFVGAAAFAGRWIDAHSSAWSLGALASKAVITAVLLVLLYSTLPKGDRSLVSGSIQQFLKKVRPSRT